MICRTLASLELPPESDVDIHVPTQQLNLQSDNGLPNPDDREHTRKHKRRLFARGAHGEEHAQEETEDERTPGKKKLLTNNPKIEPNRANKYHKSQSLNPSLIPP